MYWSLCISELEDSGLDEGGKNPMHLHKLHRGSHLARDEHQGQMEQAKADGNKTEMESYTLGQIRQRSARRIVINFVTGG
jgi:hypothetical protein